MSGTRDYQDWHREYDDPGSGLAWRLQRVRQHLRDALERHPGEIRVLSVCAGGLTRVEVLTADAGTTDAYLGAVPADLVILVGIFGNVTEDDLGRIIAFAPQLCATGASLVWSRGRRLARELPGVTAGDLNSEVRARFRGAGFTELAYERRDTGSRSAGARPAALHLCPVRGVSQRRSGGVS